MRDLAMYGLAGLIALWLIWWCVEWCQDLRWRLGGLRRIGISLRDCECSHQEEHLHSQTNAIVAGHPELGTVQEVTCTRCGARWERPIGKLRRVR